MAFGKKYDKSGKLYPKDDFKTQAIIDHRLAFDSSEMYSVFLKAFTPMAFNGSKEINQEMVQRLKEKLGFLEMFLKDTGYLAGTTYPTVADFVLIASYTTIGITKDLFVNLDEFPIAQKWAENVAKAIPNYEKVNSSKEFKEQHVDKVFANLGKSY